MVAYTSDAMPGTRIARTLEKLRAGGLPLPDDAKRAIAVGSGKQCSGCGDVIGSTEKSYCVRVGERTGLIYISYATRHGFD
jgi:hypothetical protein